MLRNQRHAIPRVLGAEMGNDTFDGRFAEKEIQQRVDIFNDCEHHWFENSGHMVYYDELGCMANV